ncbi:hypothetical protein VOLCADRAFT_97457 [Volvox carteri f. nagariensis]|uniref:Endonuclease/exonuclease/phosphatase domain-containing protein n=1 Tax=Volvox carteri f. nagariensis TaxID=3068 RepID=D8UCT2_VOLCA|nr:uncharacterized protein VOLCADRAFT_97457 [Volvox carteri f. nagariensis]EFJ42444.1 hypothetical protein VOLCADRAFT_97457 [Volvox carteri f. nagariensis]|eukprot:XP_002956507.1 hypothetical protein VOLCADRAFT_97457 [Volvox carteri f. nagariensis]
MTAGAPAPRPPQALAETTSSTDGHIDGGALVIDGLPATWTHEEVIQKLQLCLQQLTSMRVVFLDCTVEAHPNVAACSSKRTTQRVRITTTPAAYYALYTLRKQLGLNVEEGADVSFPAVRVTLALTALGESYKKGYQDVFRHLVDRLAIVNGQAPGDVPGGFTYSNSTEVHSSIDLCLASYGLFEQINTLKVLRSYLWGESNVLSDHHPLILRLHADLRPGAARGQKPHLARERIPIFDISRKGRFSELFREPDGIITATINSLKEKLVEGAPCGESMNDLCTLIDTCARETFGVARGMEKSVKRDWWNEDCAAAWNDMMRFRKEVRDPVSGKLPDLHRNTWKAKHRAFKKVRKAAIQEIEMEDMRRRIKDARSNPRGLWTWLRGGKPPPCGISDINAFTERFWSGETRQCRNEGIQFKWLDADQVTHRRELAAWLNKDFTEDEIARRAGAVFVLAPYSTVLYNHIYGAEYPRGFMTSTLPVASAARVTIDG